MFLFVSSFRSSTLFLNWTVNLSSRRNIMTRSVLKSCPIDTGCKINDGQKAYCSKSIDSAVVHLTKCTSSAFWCTLETSSWCPPTVYHHLSLSRSSVRPCTGWWWSWCCWLPRWPAWCSCSRTSPGTWSSWCASPAPTWPLRCWTSSTSTWPWSSASGSGPSTRSSSTSSSPSGPSGPRSRPMRCSRRSSPSDTTRSRRRRPARRKSTS